MDISSNWLIYHRTADGVIMERVARNDMTLCSRTRSRDRVSVELVTTSRGLVCRKKQGFLLWRRRRTSKPWPVSMLRWLMDRVRAGRPGSPNCRILTEKYRRGIYTRREVRRGGLHLVTTIHDILLHEIDVRESYNISFHGEKMVVYRAPPREPSFWVLIDHLFSNRFSSTLHVVCGQIKDIVCRRHFCHQHRRLDMFFL